VLSLRQSELLHEQDGAAATANADRAGSPRFAVSAVGAAGTRRFGVRAAETGKLHDFPSGRFALARGCPPSLPAELHVSDLISVLLRP
jgi:hypothetical protein